MNDAPDEYQDDPTWLFYVRLGSFNSPLRFQRTLEFFLRFAEDCPFVEHPLVCAYSLKNDPKIMRFERHEIRTLQQKREFMSFYEKIWQDRPNGTVRLEFVQKKVSLKVFVLWLKKIGHFMQSMCQGESFYISDIGSDYIYKWKVGTSSFFDDKQIVEIYKNIFPDANVDEQTSTQTVIDALAGMHRAKGYPYITTLCYIRRYPDMFRGYKVETFGIYNFRMPLSPDLHMMSFLKVTATDRTMTVDECLDFWDRNFVSKLTASDRSMISSDCGYFDVIVICDDKIIKKTDGKTSGIILKDVGNKELRIIAVDKNLVPVNPEFRIKDNEFGALLSERQFSLAKREFGQMYERWRLCVIL